MYFVHEIAEEPHGSSQRINYMYVYKIKLSNFVFINKKKRVSFLLNSLSNDKILDWSETETNCRRNF